MDRSKFSNNAEPNEQFQQETGPERRIQPLLVNSASSPLFYTVVSGTQNVGSKKYYVEQLGCPSIIKPSFRDLPGCTRLSAVGLSSPSYRQFPLDKLNKTIMGKSPPTTTATGSFGKRFSVNRGEKFMSPIKVNAKIRHIYSHITTSTSESSIMSHQSSISTHTQTDQATTDYDPPIQSIDEETSVDEDLRKDVFTCMTPPPFLTQMGTEPSLAYSIPPAYAGKLEDLEKITGHIVIQRFFTRADEAFGIWLEKQLGMNVKSVGVGEEGINDPAMDATASTHPNLDKYETNRISSAKKLRESRILEKIIEVDDILTAEEVIPVTYSNLKNELPLSENPRPCGIDDKVKCECFWEQFNVHDESCEKVILSAKAEDLTKIEEEIISQCIAVEIIRGKLKDEQLETELRLQQQQQIRLDAKMNTEHNKEQREESSVIKLNSDENDISFATHSCERPCIPDVIDVSQFYNSKSVLQQYPKSEEATETNEDSEELKTVISNPSMTESQLESQNKVAEYLGKLEISSPINDVSTSANSINSELDGIGGESSKDYKDNMDGVELASDVKRSLSVDSCIGTESSGERNIFNDSGILLDYSARMDIGIPEESEMTIVPAKDVDIENIGSRSADVKTQIQELESEDAVPLRHAAVPLLSNVQSIDDSTNYSRSDQSSALKHISDEGGDADQSESNSDSELSSLRKGSLEGPARMNMDDTELDDPNEVMVDEDDGEGSEQDELDQFDTIIENHEKEKRLRPIYRKRNVSTQTSTYKSAESSTVSCTTDSRSTTATSESSFDLEFVSKTKKYISHIPSNHAHHESVGVGGDMEVMGKKHRSYLPTGSSGLNILNMKFTMGREFESEVSIRIPPKSPTNSISSSNSFNYQNLPNAIITPNKSSSKFHAHSQTQQLPVIIGKSTSTSSVRQSRGVDQQSATFSSKLAPLQQQDPELKSLWKDVKSKMDSRVETELEVTGSRIKLTNSSSAETTASTAIRQTTRSMTGNEPEGTKLPVLISSSEHEKLKRSLIRLKRILDD